MVSPSPLRNVIVPSTGLNQLRNSKGLLIVLIAANDSILIFGKLSINLFAAAISVDPRVITSSMRITSLSYVTVCSTDKES